MRGRRVAKRLEEIEERQGWGDGRGDLGRIHVWTYDIALERRREQCGRRDQREWKSLEQRSKVSKHREAPIPLHRCSAFGGDRLSRDTARLSLTIAPSNHNAARRATGHLDNHLDCSVLTFVQNAPSLARCPFFTRHVHAQRKRHASVSSWLSSQGGHCLPPEPSMPHLQYCTLQYCTYPYIDSSGKCRPAMPRTECSVLRSHRHRQPRRFVSSFWKLEPVPDLPAACTRAPSSHPSPRIERFRARKARILPTAAFRVSLFTAPHSKQADWRSVNIPPRCKPKRYHSRIFIFEYSTVP